MERIEAVELLNTHFFSDTSKCREAWYFIRAELLESPTTGTQQPQADICPECDGLGAYMVQTSPDDGEPVVCALCQGTGKRSAVRQTLCRHKFFSGDCMCVFQCDSCFHRQVCASNPNTIAVNEECALYVNEKNLQAHNSAMDAMSCIGCKYVGASGDKEVHEKCFKCVRALLLRGEDFDYYTPQHQ